MSERCENCIAPKGKPCPLWIGHEAGVIAQNPGGEQKFITGCFPSVFIKLMEYVVRTNTSAAAAAESARNEIARGFDNVHRVIDIARDIDTVRQLEAAVAPRIGYNGE